MAEQYELIIRNAVLRDNNKVDLAVKDGKIAAIDAGIPSKAATEIDAEGNLVTESFVNAHLHLCKVYTLMMMDETALKDYHGADMGRAMSAIEAAMKVKEQYDERWIIKNVRKAVALAGRYGCTHIRAFADVDSKAKLEGVKALLQAREEFKGIVELQVAAFAQDGLVREAGAEKLLREAIRLGCDVVGGIPWIEYTDAAIAEHVRICFDIAKEFSKPVSMLVDDAGDNGLRSLEVMALETIRTGMQGRALAHHARAMALYPKPYLQKLTHLLKEARLGLVSDPHTGPLHARVRELTEEQVLVCLGQDDISDAYYPYGRNNMLEVAFLNSHLLWYTTRDDMETLYDMVTVNAAKCMGIEDFGLAIGKTANLVVLDQPNTLEALRFHERPRAVVSHGKLVDQSKLDEIYREENR